jgi:hypothetical protein
MTNDGRRIRIFLIFDRLSTMRLAQPCCAAHQQKFNAEKQRSGGFLSLILCFSAFFAPSAVYL